MIAFDLGTLVLVACIAFLVAGALAPLETLGWWAGWYGDGVDAADVEHEAATATRVPVAVPPHEHYVVFLSGIHSAASETHSAREAHALEELRSALPEAAVLEVFPYSVTNRALTGERYFSAFWRWLLRAKLSRRRAVKLAGFLINIRNVWQVGVSADRRYGPYYNRGSAQLVVGHLVRRGYPLGGGAPVMLIGYSGGGQVAVGAAPFVKELTGGDVTVVSLGGVLAADPGLLETDRVFHLYGRRDGVQRLGAFFFPGRWPILSYSPWNEARRRGTLRSVLIGPSDHTGAGGYLDANTRAPDGRTYLQITIDVLSAIARGANDELPVATTP
ncbi:hypothetical protein BH23DEI1_BH23DEI1_19160 [soil metagenome]|nr:hypothetical protein [Trueperaceae bacterium]